MSMWTQEDVERYEKGVEMKQQILCTDCGTKPLKQYPGEWNKTVKGTARTNYICDLCAANIFVGRDCYAQSMGLDRHPYYEWEPEFISSPK